MFVLTRVEEATEPPPLELESLVDINNYLSKTFYRNYKEQAADQTLCDLEMKGHLELYNVCKTIETKCDRLHKLLTYIQQPCRRSLISIPAIFSSKQNYYNRGRLCQSVPFAHPCSVKLTQSASFDRVRADEHPGISNHLGADPLSNAPLHQCTKCAKELHITVPMPMQVTVDGLQPPWLHDQFKSQTLELDQTATGMYGQFFHWDFTVSHAQLGSKLTTQVIVSIDQIESAVCEYIAKPVLTNQAILPATLIRLICSFLIV